jgi:hypothetical protein
MIAPGTATLPPIIANTLWEVGFKLYANAERTTAYNFTGWTVEVIIGSLALTAGNGLTVTPEAGEVSAKLRLSMRRPRLWRLARHRSCCCSGRLAKQW